MSVESVKRAIDAWYGDTSRSKRETLEGLEEMEDHLETMITCLSEEIDREEGEDDE